MQRPAYYVSRQSYWPDGENVVEIAGGGIEYANADMLSDDETYKRLGSSTEYEDPREALEAAFRVRDEWAKHAEDVRVEAGFTHGCSLPFYEHPTDDELRTWAEKEHAWIEEHAETCQKCGDPIFGDNWWYIIELGEDLKFCSEQCVDDYYYAEYLDDVADREHALA